MMGLFVVWCAVLTCCFGYDFVEESRAGPWLWAPSFVFVERFWIAGHCKSKAWKEPQKKEVVCVSFVMSIYMTWLEKKGVSTG